MQELRLVTAIDEGTKLLLRGPDGAEFALPVDERLKAAARGDRVRFGQLQIELDEPLRPRDIQARIRAGESAEQVATASGLPLERVRRYEGPVLAEREHMASLARRTPIRGPALPEGPPPMLGDLVNSRLREWGVDAEAATWDSWRREDGRWQVAVVYQRPPRPTDESAGEPQAEGPSVKGSDAGGQVRSIARAAAPGEAHADATERAFFAFDPARRLVLAEEDNARALIAYRQVVVAEPVAPHRAEEYDDAIVTRLPPGGDVEFDGTGALGPSATPRVGVPAMGGLVPLAPVPPRRQRPADIVAGRGSGLGTGQQRPADGVPGRRPPQSGEPTTTEKRRSTSRPRRPHIPASATAPIRRPSPYDDRILVPGERPSAREGARPTKRASLPSWDEILFGTRTRTPPE